MATARREIMPHLAVMTHHCKNRDLTVAMTARYDLDAEHVSFVTGSGKDTNKVQSIVEDAEERKAELAVEHSGGAFEGATAGETSVEGDEDEDEASEEQAQVTLGDSEAAEEDDDEPSPEERADEATDDDQQSGLGDFV
ncbi:hypothetical protein VB773_16505 [Haloarculaceae archaeon H-GB2-1]|nr:hypothetical protein [Haloarculaceae archaeon H-GB2-1]